MTSNAEDIKREDIVDEEVKEKEVQQETGEEQEESTGGNPEEKPEEKPEESEQEDEGEKKYLRLMADFQNYKKRVEKEKKDLYSYANEKIMTELLEVMDNFERALEQNAAAEGSGEGFATGMEMIFKQLVNVLEKEGLKEIEALGEEFDPNFHNAVMTEETEEYESGKVSGVMQKGYTLNGKVIRPSMVKVVS
ncbi:MAG: nucleotide exchange factor GrpE [Bacillota bacterium]|nr:nucleotide exchange factor GrpE [Bacillota bacterium]